ncbi:hypothetical protein [Polaromonas sp.]|uniref:hypothetical protein n=1 Tax=Polaromonas sp. TaxID=1869339 RepID=UPI0017EC9C0B|nr:hypothetical protein [Polaromonas sp.]NMM06341.1 hypothetical protein [Polaromonas sp.]
MNITNLSRLKLEQIASHCGSTVAAVTVGQLLANPAYDINGVASALSTTPVNLLQALALPEPVVYAPMTTTNV